MCRGTHGQASLEYLGIVAVVALVLGALAVPALAGSEVGGGVVRQMERALCVVSHGDCEEDRRPCVVSSDSTQDSGHVDLLVLHTGTRELVLREARSDGTVAVTFLRSGENGLQVGVGDGGELRIGGRVLRVGVQASAQLLRLAGEGRTWVLAPAEADVLVRRLVVDDAGDLGDRILHGGADLDGFPAPQQTSTQTGLEVSISGSVSRGRAQASLTLTGAALAGSTVDAATGRRTYLVRTDASLAGDVTLSRSAGADGTVGAAELVTVTVDASGKPVDLGVLDSGDLAGSARLPGPVRRLLGLSGQPQGARRWELERHLDLTVPANLDAARGFLAEAASPGLKTAMTARVGDALRARLDEAAIVDARTYAVSDATGGVDADGQAGPVRVGAGFEREERSARLLAAAQRGLDGIWRTRTDCVGAAR